MKIRITGCTDQSMWYSGCIGQEFGVYEEAKGLAYDTLTVYDSEGRLNIVCAKDLSCVAEPTLEEGLPSKSDGSTASYYQLPKGCTELQDLISYKDMNAQIGEIMRACYRYGEVQHSEKIRDAKKIKFYAEAEIKRLENE